jgi:uncharacterized membrane protein YkoI
MKMHILMFTAIAAVSAAAVAAGPASSSRPLRLGEMVTHMESAYHGEVTAIQFDASGDKRAHYHVDIRFPRSALARLDVDAVTREISAHQAPPLAPEFATLSEVTTLVAAQLPGQLTIAELDAGDGVAPHYDVDVRVPGGKIARLKVDAATRSIGWCQPAIIEE